MQRERGQLATIALAARFALRELRGGLAGFRIFLACIALGTAAIGAVNTVADGIGKSIAAQGQSILAGDIGFELVQREATPDELAKIAALGTVAKTVGLRSMARLPDGSDQSLVELKAVDGIYPLYGAVKTASTKPLAELLAKTNGTYGAIAPQLLFDRLGLRPGDRLAVGDVTVELRDVLISEPDALSDGFGFAPRLMMAMEALPETGLIREGSLAEFGYKVRLANPPDLAGMKAMQEKLRADLRDDGFRIRTSANAAPALSDSVERFSQFLALVGLCALLVGGVGVANAVQAHLDAKRPVIATLKSLGAGHGLVASVYLIQTMIASVIGVAIGLVLAAIIPPLAGTAIARFLPIDINSGLQPGALALAAAFGLLTTLAFSLIPIGRTRSVTPQLLFRDAVSSDHAPAPLVWRAAALIVMALVAALAIFTSVQPRMAAYLLAGALASFLVLGLVGVLVVKLAARVPRFKSTVARLAIGNMHRPGAITRPVVISLGLGLTLLTAVSLIDTNLRSQISGSIAGKAPDFFFLDIQSREIEQFKALLAETAPQGAVTTVPMLRGRITALKGIRIENYKVPPEASWVTRGDRGITYAPTLPSNSTLAAGAWWPADYTGEPLVSFASEEAGELGLALGDTVTVNVLGRDITAKIANLRQVEWRSMSINFVMVFSPSIFKGAPHAWLATLADPQADAAQEAKVLNQVTRTFPAITSVRVKDALSIASNFIEQFSLAIRVAASVALATSVLVLAGALAAGNRNRLHDAVVLKMLGATRRTLVSAYALEYLLIGLATAVFAILAGSVAAWFVVDYMMNLTFAPEPLVAAATIALSLIVTIGFGLAGTWRLLGQKAAPVLRDL
ncbi:MAG: ABC transporter permease [Rhizobiaceae bacterium]